MYLMHILLLLYYSLYNQCKYHFHYTTHYTTDADYSHFHHTTYQCKYVKKNIANIILNPHISCALVLFMLHMASII